MKELKKIWLFLGVFIITLGIIGVVRNTDSTFAVSTSACPTGYKESLNNSNYCCPDTYDYYYAQSESNCGESGSGSCGNSAIYGNCYREYKSGEFCDSNETTYSFGNSTGQGTGGWCYRGSTGKTEYSCYNCAGTYIWSTTAVSGCTKTGDVAENDCLAHNTQNSYTVNFIVGTGGTFYENGVAQTRYDRTLSTIDYSKYTAEKDGYGFTGWGTTENCSSGKTSGTETITGATTLYACYATIIEIKPKVTFNFGTDAKFYLKGEDGEFFELNGEFISNGKTSMNFNTGDKVDYSKYKAEKSGYTFKGWCVNSNSCTNPHLTGTYTLSQSSITLYASWEKDESATTYTAYFDKNGGTWTDGSTTYTKTITYSDKVDFGTDSRVQVQRSGYKLTGWKVKGTDTIYYKNIDATDNGKTLVAIWTLNSATTEPTPTKYNVTFNTNDGTLYVGGIKTTSNIIKLSSLNYSTYTASKENYSFTGWSSDASCNSPTKSGTLEVTEDINLYACYIESGTTENPKEYNVTFDVGTNAKFYVDGNETSVKTASLSEIDYSIYTAQKDGYLFIGWSSSSSCTSGKNQGVVPVNEDTTLYACYVSDTSSETGNEEIDNPTTGSWLLYIVYLVGIVSLGYTGYYSYKLKKNK